MATKNIYEGARTENGYFHTIFLTTARLLHTINYKWHYYIFWRYYTTIRWYSSSHKRIRAKILNGFWEKLDKVQPTFWNLNFSLVDFGVFQPQNSHYYGPNIIQISPDNFLIRSEPLSWWRKLKSLLRWAFRLFFNQF